MSTNASIAVQYDDGSYQQIYLHWDGDTGSAGKTLREHYSSQELAEALMDLGDLSQLGPVIGTQTDFGSPRRGQCVAYGRDRGESGVASEHFRNFNDLCRGNNDQQYNYLFIEGAWHVCNGSIALDKLLPLTEPKEINV